MIIKGKCVCNIPTELSVISLHFFLQIALHFVLQISKEVVVQHFANARKLLYVNGGAAKYVVGSASVARQGFGKPHYRASLPFQFIIYCVPYVHKKGVNCSFIAYYSEGIAKHLSRISTNQSTPMRELQSTFLSET